MLFSLLSSIFNAGSIIVDKIVLAKKKVPNEFFIPVLFLFVFIISGALYPFLGSISIKALSLSQILAFLGMMAAAVIQNIAYYKALKSEKVIEFELLNMLLPLVTVVLAAIVLPAERNIHIFIAAAVASLALILVHFKKTYLRFAKYSGTLFIAVIFIAIESLFQKVLLNDYSPVALYFFRGGLLFIIFWLIFNPNFIKAKVDSFKAVFWSALLAEGTMIFRFYSFASQGIVFTILILVLAPFLVYMFSFIFLKEKPSVRIIVGAFVVMAAIVYATIMGK
jgi:drug/metabolite transporter (DMT)-like permease